METRDQNLFLSEAHLFPIKEREKKSINHFNQILIISNRLFKCKKKPLLPDIYLMTII